MITRYLLLCAALPLAAPALSIVPAFAQQYAVSGTIALGGSGAWDYLAADSDGRRLYVSHTSEVNVVDLDSGKPVGTMAPEGGTSKKAIWESPIYQLQVPIWNTRRRTLL